MREPIVQAIFYWRTLIQVGKPDHHITEVEHVAAPTDCQHERFN